jgi:hypothetical protein
MAWWLNRTGQPEGPYDDAQLLQLIGSGQLRGGHICQQGSHAWTPIEQHPVFGPAIARGGAAPPPAYAPGPGYPQAGPAAKKGSPVGIIIAVVVGVLMVAGVVVVLVVKGPTSRTTKTIEPKEAARRAKAFEDKLPKLKKIGATAFPLIETEGYSEKVPDPTFDSSLAFEKSQLVIYTNDFQEEDLEDGKMLFRVGGGSRAADCLKDLDEWKKKKGSNESVSADLLEACGDFTHVFVIRVTSVDEPEVTTKAGDSVTFDGGSVEGHVAAFVLDSGKFVGGFDFSAASSDELRVPAGSSDPSVVLRDDLMRQLVSALNAGHRRAAGGTKTASPPASSGSPATDPSGGW